MLLRIAFFFFYQEVHGDIRRELFVGAEKVKITMLNRNDVWKSNFLFRKVNLSFNHDLLHSLYI